MPTRKGVTTMENNIWYSVEMVNSAMKNWIVFNGFKMPNGLNSPKFDGTLTNPSVFLNIVYPANVET